MDVNEKIAELRAFAKNDRESAETFLENAQAESLDSLPLVEQLLRQCEASLRAAQLFQLAAIYLRTAQSLEDER